jgi:TetR/AcrR family transcriptional regulator, transcriptional repressor for nem operon
VEKFFRASLSRASHAGLIEPAIRPAMLAEVLLATVLAIRVFARLDPDRARLRRLADHALSPLIANKRTARR